MPKLCTFVYNKFRKFWYNLLLFSMMFCRLVTGDCCSYSSCSKKFGDLKYSGTGSSRREIIL